MRRVLISLGVPMLLAGLVTVAAAGGKAQVESTWQLPGLDTLDVRSIALLPAATYDGSFEARKAIEQALATALRGSGHRWVSASTSHDLLLRAGGDSLLKALNQTILKRGTIDSASAPVLSQATRTRALLAVRVDRFEKMEMEFNQAGKPSTTVGLTAALVDSTGRLLWTAEGSETAEGPYQDPTTAAIGVKESGLNNQPLTNQAGAPSYLDTTARLLARWLPRFPKRAAAH